MMEPVSLPPETHIGDVRLQVRDLDASLTFYRDILGFLEKQQEGGTAILAADPRGSGLIYLVARPDAIPKPRRTVGLFHVAVRLPSRLALGRVFQHLLERSWSIEGASDHRVSEAIYLSDPDGNGLELYRDRPRQDWPIRNGQVAMSTDRLDLNSLLQEAAQDPSPWSGIDPGTDIGHVHLQVSNLDRAEAFYCGLLGLEVMQRDYPGALFVSAGGYHHHVGLNIWASQGAPRPPENAAGILSFLLDIPDPDWRMELIVRCRTAGVPMRTSLIQGDNGRVLILDPDGNGVEVEAKLYSGS